MKMHNSTEDISTVFMADRYRLMAFIRSMVRDHHVAEDLFQEVWIRLSKAIESGVEIQDTAKWCRGTAKNLILHHWRAEKRSPVFANSELLDRVELAFEEQDVAQDAWRRKELALKSCLDELPERSREVLSLKYEANLTVGAVASRLGRTTAAIMMLLSRLRQGLEGCVEKKVQAGGSSL